MRVEWPTIVLVALCYLAYGISLFVLPEHSLLLAVPAAAVTIALHSSLQHEIIHGHPTRWRWLNAGMVYPTLNLSIPFERFRDTHLAHHMDARLTDPYDDPESNYLDPAVWDRLPRLLRSVLQFNNLLVGRLTIGPLVSQIAFMAADWRMIRGGDTEIARIWARHVLVVAAILALVAASPMPIWAYLIAAYAGLSILKIRTYLEHQAHEKARARTVIIEDRGPLAFLFLNNNFHVVHHMHPRLPWYALPRTYRANPERYLTRNEGYRYRSYLEIFARHLWRAKDPVPHPLWPQNDR